LYSDGVLCSGQSGGPAMSEGVIVGVNVGGHARYNAVEDKDKTVTWPAILGSARRLNEILNWAVKNDVSKSTKQ
jgi:hypothetical protein